MTVFLKNVSLIGISYLIGAIPFSVIISKIKGVNLLKEAVDGARGASLTWRKAGKTYGFFVGLLDVLKGTTVVLLAKKISGDPKIIVTAALFAIVGHNWSIYIKFTGGKGAAITAGEFLTLLPKEFLLSLSFMIIPLILLKNKKNLLILKKKFKKPNFLSGVFFGIMFILANRFNEVCIYSFSPLIFSCPMLIKDIQIKINQKNKKI